jgi:hypothetical protein
VAVFKSEGEVRYPVLTDMDNGYALSLNLAIWVGDEMQKILESGGRQLPNYQGNDAWVLANSSDICHCQGRHYHRSLYRPSAWPSRTC